MFFYDNCRSVDINYENKTVFFWGNKYFQKLDKYDSPLMTVHWTLIMRTKHFSFGGKIGCWAE